MPVAAMRVQARCPLCGAGSARLLLAKRFPYDQRLVRCAACRVVRLNGGRFTPDYWQDDAVALEVYADDAVRAEVGKKHERHCAEIERRLGAPGRLLDVGCGIGDFLVVAERRGWEACGVEPSAKAAAIARGRGFDVEQVAVEQSRIAPGTLDAVTMWDVIEHLERPVAALAAVNAKLRHGGVVFLETPDEAFCGRAVIRLAFALSRGRFDLSSYVYYPDHRFYFTARTLGRLLRRTGFDDVRVARDVSSAAKARRKIAPWGFPLARLVVGVLPAALAFLARIGIRNKLTVTARKP